MKLTTRQKTGVGLVVLSLIGALAISWSSKPYDSVTTTTVEGNTMTTTVFFHPRKHRLFLKVSLVLCAATAATGFLCSVWPPRK